jgi:acyl-coenzyme A thioesterase PaaI-like protein
VTNDQLPTGQLTVDAVNSMVTEQFPGSRNYCVELGPDFAVAAYDVDDASLRPGGFVSGPTQFGLVDAAFWFVTFVALGRIEPMALTSELSIRFLRPAVGTRIICRATLEAASRRSVVGTAHVWAEERPDKITATAQGTYAIPLPR